ncbi:MAG: helix-hairpin-helix domain-containing protein [Acidimicrobiia bacterium]
MSSSSPFPPRPSPRGRAAVVEAVRDRAGDPRARIAALLVVATVAGFCWYQLGRQQSSAALATPAPSRSVRPRPTTTTRPPLLVHVAGAVVHPGLLRVPAGSRVDDAIKAAGGPGPGADLDRLNLAAKVADGQRIMVTVVGQPAAGGVAADPSAPAATDGGGGPGSGPVNLNTATVTELDTLPGIGPTLAAAIVRERERRGGFTSVGQLRDVRGIGDKRFADLAPLVTV